MSEIPWSEKVNMLSINPDAANRNDVARMASELPDLQSQLDAERKSKDRAYTERNRLVAFISKLYPSHRARHPALDEAWEDDWRWIICIHAPFGQLTWHIHDSHLPMFEHLETKLGDWDGHTTEEKYRRLDYAFLRERGGK